jgi:hypothetical protein
MRFASAARESVKEGTSLWTGSPTPNITTHHRQPYRSSARFASPLRSRVTVTPNPNTLAIYTCRRLWHSNVCPAATPYPFPSLRFGKQSDSNRQTRGTCSKEGGGTGQRRSPRDNGGAADEDWERKEEWRAGSQRYSIGRALPSVNRCEGQTGKGRRR